MSQIGKKPINIPDGVDVSNNNNLLSIKGKLGELSTKIVDGVNVKLNDNYSMLTYSVVYNPSESYSVSVAIEDFSISSFKLLNDSESQILLGKD